MSSGFETRLASCLRGRENTIRAIRSVLHAGCQNHAARLLVDAIITTRRLVGDGDVGLWFNVPSTALVGTNLSIASCRAEGGGADFGLALCVFPDGVEKRAIVTIGDAASTAGARWTARGDLGDWTSLRFAELEVMRSAAECAERIADALVGIDALREDYLRGVDLAT